MMRPLFPLTVDVLQKNLQLRQQRQELLSSNIANAETPGFIARDIQFEEALQQAVQPLHQGGLTHTHPRHFPQLLNSLDHVQGQVVATPSDDVGRDLNTVSVDREMAALTKNTFHYNASTEILSRLFAKIRRAISEGRV